MVLEAVVFEADGGRGHHEGGRVSSLSDDKERTERMAGSYARFAGSVGIVTGAGMGIGAAVAWALAGEGARWRW